MSELPLNYTWFMAKDSLLHNTKNKFLGHLTAAVSSLALSIPPDINNFFKLILNLPLIIQMVALRVLRCLYFSCLVETLYLQRQLLHSPTVNSSTLACLGIKYITSNIFQLIFFFSDMLLMNML